MIDVFQKKRLSLNANSWTSVVAPFDCDYFSVRNLTSGDIWLRTEENDSNSEDIIAPGMQDGVFAAARGSNIRTQKKLARFLKNDVICYLRLPSGTGEVITTFVK